MARLKHWIGAKLQQAGRPRTLYYLYFSTVGRLRIRVLCNNFFFAVFGNAFVIAAVQKDYNLHTPFNYLVVNLAISDIYVFVFSLPLIVFNECFSWPFGEVFRFSVFRSFSAIFHARFFFVFAGVSIGTMVTLSYERYRAVVKPLLRRLTHKFAKGLIIVIWVLSYILFALPKSFMYELSIGHGMLHCDPVYRSLTVNIFMKIWLFIFILILPCAFICWCYNRGYAHTHARSSVNWWCMPITWFSQVPRKEKRENDEDSFHNGLCLHYLLFSVQRSAFLESVPWI